MIFYKVYPKALSATLISVIAGALIGGGIVITITAFTGGSAESILAAVIMAGVGILLRKLADKQAVRVWRKKNLM
ncbi:hypothetical protein [uncultured Ruminococcus sp.]|uniref:hypothetical protein n=1 Tax=uncultured Ruminococcus sp. TaxID=165186 RepID=UPI0029301A6F|nr:hypothetical protein [uncultured Ruminococcus sp.]